MIKLGLQIDNRFRSKVRGRYGRYQFETGVLQDKPYLTPRRPRAIGTLQGGPVRRTGVKTRGTVADVSKAMRKRTDFYRKPFEKKRSKDMRAFVKGFFGLAQGLTTARRVETLLRAVVRNPILKGDYGKRNAASTARAKGFSRFFFDTGQLFKSIAAKVRSKRVS